MSAQAGVFTYHPGIEEYRPDTLMRVRIPRERRREVLRQLRICGIDEHFIYQDFDGLGATLRQKVGSLFDD